MPETLPEAFVYSVEHERLVPATAVEPAPPAAAPRKLTLRDLDEMLSAWSDTLSGMDDADLDFDLVREKYEHIRKQHEDKVDRHCWMIYFAEAMEKECATGELRYGSRKMAWRRLAEHLRGYSRDLMVANQKKRLEGKQCRITLVDGQPKLEIYDPAQLPREYCTWVPEEIIAGHTIPDKEAIERALLAKKEVPGARLIPRPHIQIR